MTALAALAATSLLAGCLPASGDEITAAQVAAAIPEFASVDPQVPLGYTPNPGARRTFRAADIERLAQRLGLHIARPRSVCFEWRLRAVMKEEVLAAMRRALGNTEVRIEILEMSRQPAPAGELVFDADRLSSPPGNDARLPVIWHGFIEYGLRRRFNLWARVRLSAPAERIVAAKPIRAGATIESDDVRLEVYEGFPAEESPRLDEVIGQVSLRPLQAGMSIPGRLLRSAPLVRYGDEVSVIVRTGRAVVKTEGRAETSGKLGEEITVRNLNSRRTFKAKVVAAGHVSVRALRD